MNTHDRDRLLVLWRRVLRAMQILQTTVSEIVGIMARVVPAPDGPGSLSNLMGKADDEPALFDRPIVDMVAMTVTWRGGRCPLGYTRLLDLMERLVRNPRRWIPYDRLLREVWGDEMLGENTIKVAVTRLKAKLIEYGMADLAQNIGISGFKCGYFPEGVPK